MRVLGIDPAIGCTGYAVIDTADTPPRVLEAGTIQTTAGVPLADRLVEIHAQVDTIVAEHRPDHVAIEALYAHYRHPRTAIVMGHARGAVMLAVAGNGVEVLDLPATRIKRCLTGNGHASKQNVQRAVQICLGLAKLPGPSDVSDALAIALTAGRELAQAARSGIGGVR